MIGKVLKQLVSDLNDYFAGIYPSHGDPHAKLTQITEDELGENGAKIVANLIHLEEDKVYKNHLIPETGRANTDPIHPLGGLSKMRVNVYVLFAFNPGTTPEHYADALTRLTHLLRYFNEASSRQITVNLPDPKIFNLVIDYHNISLEDSNNMWSNMGGKQKPYALYQIKMLEIDPIPIDPAAREVVLEETIISNPDKNGAGETLYNPDGSPKNDKNTIQQLQ